MRLLHIYYLCSFILLLACNSIIDKHKTTTNKNVSIIQGCQGDTSILNYDWGNEVVVFLSSISIKNEEYKVEAIEVNIKMIDSYRRRRFIVFTSKENIYKYELESRQKFPSCIYSNKLIFQEENCSENIEEIGMELLCLDCMDDACLLLEYDY